MDMRAVGGLISKVCNHCSVCRQVLVCLSSCFASVDGFEYVWRTTSRLVISR